MANDSKPGANFSMPTIPTVDEQELYEAKTRLGEIPADVREMLAQHEAADLGMSAPTIPSFTVPGLPGEERQDSVPSSGLVNDLIAESLQQAAVRPRNPTISSILGGPTPLPMEVSRTPLQSLADQIPPSIRGAAPVPGATEDPAAELAPRRSRAARMVVIFLLVALGLAIAFVFRSRFY